jgi:hypothetical protein
METLEIGRLTLKWEESKTFSYTKPNRHAVFGVDIYLADVLLGYVFEKENFCPVEFDRIPVDLIVPYRDLARAIEEARLICG